MTPDAPEVAEMVTAAEKWAADLSTRLKAQRDEQYADWLSRGAESVQSEISAMIAANMLFPFTSETDRQARASDIYARIEEAQMLRAIAERLRARGGDHDAG